MEVRAGVTGRPVLDEYVVFDQAPVELGAKVLGEFRTRDVNAGRVESKDGTSVFGGGGWRTPHV